MDTIRSFPNQGMWKEMRVDGDGEWIRESLIEGTLDIAHDGSCQPDVTKDVCYTTVLLRCRRTKRQLFTAFAKKLSGASTYVESCHVE